MTIARCSLGKMMEFHQAARTGLLVKALEMENKFHHSLR
jgi:hypothetical protein